MERQEMDNIASQASVPMIATATTASAPPPATTTTATTDPTTPQPTTQTSVSPTRSSDAPQVQEALGFRQRLDAGEEHWRWKLPFRIALLISAVIGTGCIGWAVQTANAEQYYWLYDDQAYLWWALITFGVSILWTAVYLLVLLLRRPPRPVHPGVAVGLDLVLWLAYIFTTLFVIIACINVLQLGAGGVIGRYSSDGYYTLSSNGTWVYNPTDYMTWSEQTRDCDSASSSATSYHNSPSEAYFKNCEEQDAWVNAVYRASKHRGQVEVMGAVCQGLCFILHFILFVWACVDTHRRNRRRPSKEAEKLAAEIVSRMVREGAVLQAPQSWRYQNLNNEAGMQGWYRQNVNGGYTVHQGPPPPVPGQNTAMAGATQGSQVTEHYGDVKGRGLGGPGLVQQQ